MTQETRETPETPEAEKAVEKKPRGRKRERKAIPSGKAFITSTFNNTMVTLSDPQGNVISWGSSGTAGFKGSRKGTPYAAQLAAHEAARKAMDHGLRQVGVYVKGPGSGREAAIRSLQSSGLYITSITDMSPIPSRRLSPSKKEAGVEKYGKIY